MGPLPTLTRTPTPTRTRAYGHSHLRAGSRLDTRAPARRVCPWRKEGDVFFKKEDLGVYFQRRESRPRVVPDSSRRRLDTWGLRLGWGSGDRDHKFGSGEPRDLDDRGVGNKGIRRLGIGGRSVSPVSSRSGLTAGTHRPGPREQGGPPVSVAERTVRPGDTVGEDPRTSGKGRWGVQKVRDEGVKGFTLVEWRRRGLNGPAYGEGDGSSLGVWA